MSLSTPRLCRVSVHADATRLDVALPAGVPIVELLPSLVDLLATGCGAPRIDLPVLPYRLSRPGSAALDSSKTLAQQSVRDGTVLLLTRASDDGPQPRFDDAVEQVAATVRARSQPWTPGAARSTAAVCAVGLAAVSGFVAVPGGPGAPNALLAAAAATAAAVLAMQRGETGPTLTALCALAVLAGAAALTAVLGRFPPPLIGAASTAAALVLLHLAGRLSIIIRRLAQPTRPAVALGDSAAQTHDLLTGLVAAFSAAAALGASGAAVGAQAGGAPRFGAAALAAVAGLALLLRARSHTDRSQVAALIFGGVGALGGALVAAAPQYPGWLAAAGAALACGALYLGGGPVLSPTARRAAELLEYPVLAAVAPLACWVCGCYGAVRGLNLS